MVMPRGRTPRKKWSCRWPNCSKCAQPKKRSYCTVHYKEYLCGKDNNAAENLASIRNNSAINELRDVSAVGNVGDDHAINDNNRDVALVNNVGDTEIIHNSCGTGLYVHVDNQLGVGDVVGDIDNGLPSPGLDNGFEMGWLNSLSAMDARDRPLKN